MNKRVPKKDYLRNNARIFFKSEEYIFFLLSATPCVYTVSALSAL